MKSQMIDLEKLNELINGLISQGWTYVNLKRIEDFVMSDLTVDEMLEKSKMTNTVTSKMINDITGLSERSFGE